MTSTTTATTTSQRIALVTGASRGIGRSNALHLAARGVDVIVTYLNGEAQAAAVAKEIEALGRRAVALRLDVGASGTFAGYAAYASAKAGGEVLTRYMALELGARSIKVNVVAPGPTATDFGGG